MSKQLNNKGKKVITSLLKKTLLSFNKQMNDAKNEYEITKLQIKNCDHLSSNVPDGIPEYSVKMVMKLKESVTYILNQQREKYEM